MDREKFNTILRGYWESQILFAATSAGIFDFLNKKAYTVEKIAEGLRLDQRSTEILLNALTGLELIKKHRGTYQNSPFARNHLVERSGEPLTGFVLHNMGLWNAWGNLTPVMKTGRPSEGFAVKNYRTNKRSLYNFALAMHQGSISSSKEISLLFDYSSVCSILDVGGCTGRYALSIMESSSSDRVHVLDLPEMVREAKKIIRKTNREELKKIRFIEGDFFKVDPGMEFDLVILSNIIHSLGEKDCLMLFSRLRSWLTKNGRLLVHDMTVDRSGTNPAHAALFSVNMLVNTLKGKVYSEEETLKMIRAAGMKRIDKKRTEAGNLVALCS